MPHLEHRAEPRAKLDGSSQQKPSTTVALDRHAMLRARGLPTVTALVGPATSSASTWRRWAAARGRAVQAHASAEPRGFVRHCVSELARGNDLEDRAVEWLAHARGREPDDLRRELASTTLNGLAQMFRNPLSEHPNTGTTLLIRHVCRGIVDGNRPRPEEVADALDAELEGLGQPLWRVLIAIDGLFTPGSRPVLLFAPPFPLSETQWLAAEAHLLAELAETVSGWHVAVAISEGGFEAYRHSAPDTRAKGLLTGGAVPVALPDANGIMTQLRNAGVDAGLLLDPVRRLVAERAPAEVVEAFTLAAARNAFVVSATQPGAVPDTTQADAARSAAERFLFELLDALPATAGRFTLNARLGFPFGGRAAEIDLWAESLRLAVEVDGYYHFTDPDAWRRDRRKDWELQRHGYRVLRVLAADVVERMEEVLDRILAAVDDCSAANAAARTVQGGDARRDRDRYD